MIYGKPYVLETIRQVHAQAQIGFDNWPYLLVVYWPFVRGNGTPGIQSRVFAWNGVAVAALDEVTHEVYVIQLQRETPQGLITTIELPGGGIDEGDTPLEAAKKELIEEAGVVAVDDNDWLPLYPDIGMNPVDGLVISSQHLFFLPRARKVQDPSGGETTAVTTIALSKILTMDDDNAFHDPLFPYGIARLERWLRRHRPELLT